MKKLVVAEFALTLLLPAAASWSAVKSGANEPILARFRLINHQVYLPKEK